MPDPRRSFAPVVLAGLAGAGLAAVGGHRTWATAEGAGDTGHALSQVAMSGGVGESPAAGAFALVALASWGVLLVTRGRVRRLVAGLAVAAAAAVLVVVGAGWSAAPDGVREALVGVGAADAEVSRTGWYWATGVGALVALLAAAAAVLLAPAWPEMGRRYDAPTAGAAGPTAAGDGGEPSNLDLWKALDQGEDPTT